MSTTGPGDTHGETGGNPGAPDSRYLGFFEAFNAGQHFEAHEVLEGLWLTRRGTPNAHFYQGLIQLAGAFVHLSKGRFAPAQSLFRLAQARLASYPDHHEGLNLVELRHTIADWLWRAQASLAGVGSAWDAAPRHVPMPSDSQAQTLVVQVPERHSADLRGRL